MSNDLISRSSLIKSIEKYSPQVAGSANAMTLKIIDECKKSFIRIVQSEPVAYDTDKVEEQLEELKNPPDIVLYPFIWKQAVEQAIEIVMAGGRGKKVGWINRNEKITSAIQKITDTYGYNAQSRQCIEEMAELTQAINKFWRKELKCGQLSETEVPVGSPCEKNIIEEIADVQIMLWQMEYLLDANITPVIEQKLDRQLERIKESEDFADERNYSK